jgi:hypothetical protein
MQAKSPGQAVKVVRVSTQEGQPHPPCRQKPVHYWRASEIFRLKMEKIIEENKQTPDKNMDSREPIIGGLGF